MSTYKVVKGFSYLEPKRHIGYITELDGKEARDFGPLLARAASALKEATGSKLVYVYIYGDHIPHLHVHLAPHIPGDVYVDDVVKRGVTVDESLLDSREIVKMSREIVERLNQK